MQHPLLDLLSGWRGRRATEGLLEAKGFLLHRLWQQYFLDLCGPENEAVVNRYWDEYAAEVVGSAVRHNPHHRTLPPHATYRSAFLDELAAAATFAAGRYRNLAFPRCVYEYIQRMMTDHAFRLEQLDKFDSLKEREIEKFSISAEKFSGKKRDAIPYVEEFSTSLGFSRRGRARFVKRLDPLQLEIRVDTGGFPELGGGLPLHFWISCPSDEQFVSHLTTFDFIIPGFSKYESFGSGKACVLGIRASVEAFDAFVQSFNPAP
jgi:hypothetical protein